jgi:hypothetical protein
MNSLATIIIGIVSIHIGIYCFLLLFSHTIVKLSRLGIVALEMIVLPVAASILLEAEKGYLVFMLAVVVIGTYLLAFDVGRQVRRQA